MALLTLVRQPVPIDEAQLAAFYAVALTAIDGMSEADKRAWRRFWKRLFDLVPGELVRCELTMPRNSRFHRKFFAMLAVGFDAWEPEWARTKRFFKGHLIAKDADQFRRDVTIMAGHYDVLYSLDGSLSLTAHSISFASMEDDEFERVYSSVADVLLQHVLTRYKREDLDDVVDRLMSFL